MPEQLLWYLLNSPSQLLNSPLSDWFTTHRLSAIITHWLIFAPLFGRNTSCGKSEGVYQMIPAIWFDICRPILSIKEKQERASGKLPGLDLFRCKCAATLTVCFFFTTIKRTRCKNWYEGYKISKLQYTSCPKGDSSLNNPAFHLIRKLDALSNATAFKVVLTAMQSGKEK